MDVVLGIIEAFVLAGIVAAAHCVANGTLHLFQ